MNKKFFYLFWLAVIFIAYFYTALSSMFSDSEASKNLRTKLSGSWVLIPKDRADTTNLTGRSNIIGGDGSIVTFNQYFLFTEDLFLPKQYKIDIIDYEFQGEIYESQFAINFSKNWTGYIVAHVGTDTLKLIPDYLLRSKYIRTFTFVKLKKK